MLRTVSSATLSAWLLVGGCFPNPPESGNVLQNPGFEAPGEGVPSGWTMAGAVKDKGELEIVSSPVAEGSRALCLHPNAKNTKDILSFNIGQGMSLDPLRGSTLQMRGQLLGRGGATAVLAVYAINLSGSVVAQRRLTSTSNDYELVTGTFDVPTEGGRLLIVNAHAEGTSGMACFDGLEVVAPGGTKVTEGGGGGNPPATRKAGEPLIRNSGFEAVTAAGRPQDWTLEDRVAGKGTLEVVNAPSRSGRALRLAPNGSNTNGLLAFNVGQGLPAGPLRGRSFRLSAWLGARGGATALVSAYAIDSDGKVLASRRLASTDMPPAMQDATLQVPTGDQAVLVIVAAAVEGTSGEAFFDDVTLEPAAATDETNRTVTNLTAHVSIDGGSTVREIPRTLYGQNLEWPYGGNLIWDFRSKSLNEGLIDLIANMGVDVLRWPGGLFSDFYDWRKGIGPRASRGESRITPGGDVSAHTFGTDEALALADRIGAELLITVNANTGTPADAVAWLKYVNQRQRVRFWEVGNEFYIRNDAPSNVAMPPAEYAKRLNAFGHALKQADPDALVMGIGEENFGRYTTSAFPDWDRVVLSQASGVMDYLAVHNAYFPVLFGDEGAGFREVYQALLASPELVRQNLKTLDAQIRQYAPAQADHMKIAVTEWGPLFQLDPKSRWIGHVKTLGSALYVASMLKVFVEDPRTTVATAFKLNDVGPQGWIAPRRSTILSDSPRPDDFIPTAPYYAFQMFTKHFGEELVPSTTDSPTFDAGPVGMIGRVTGAPWLDVVSARSQDGDTLYVMGINKHFDQEIQATIEVKGVDVGSGAVVWTLGGTGMGANTGSKLPAQVDWGTQIESPTNPRFDKGGPDEVWMRRSTLNPGGAMFEYAFPPHSVTSIALPLRRP